MRALLTLRSLPSLSYIISFACCADPSRNSFLYLFQKHHMLARPPKTDPDIPQIQATQGQDKMVIPCCTAGVERLAEGPGDRSLEKIEPAAERAAGPGLAVGSTEACGEEKRSIKGDEGKGRNTLIIQDIPYESHGH